MADTDASDTPSSDPHAPPAPRKPLELTKPEATFFGGILVVALLWIGAIFLFGYGGLITGALIAVAAVSLLLVVISRG